MFDTVLASVSLTYGYCVHRGCQDRSTYYCQYRFSTVIRVDFKLVLVSTAILVFDVTFGHSTRREPDRTVLACVDARRRPTSYVVPLQVRARRPTNRRTSSVRHVADDDLRPLRRRLCADDVLPRAARADLRVFRFRCR